MTLEKEKETPLWKLQLILRDLKGLKAYTPEILSLKREDLMREINILEGTQVEKAVQPPPSEEILASLKKQITEELQKDILGTLSNIKPREKTIILKETQQTRTELPQQHYQFERLLKLLQAHQNVFMVGPAGSGKSTAAKNAAKALGLDFFFNGAIDSEYKLLGFTDAQGRVVSRPFREAFLNGGLYFFDEVDGSLPGAVLAFNAALANRAIDFPDGNYQAHEDFYCVAAGNTFHGADHQYVGRNKQDAAFLDRFAVLTWGYDADLEASMARASHPDETLALRWLGAVRYSRAKASENGIQVVISPRATTGGLLALQAGLSWDEIEEVFLKKSLKNSEWEKIRPPREVPRVPREETTEETQSSKVVYKSLEEYLAHRDSWPSLFTANEAIQIGFDLIKKEFPFTLTITGEESLRSFFYRTYRGQFNQAPLTSVKNYLATILKDRKNYKTKTSLKEFLG